MTIHGNGQRPIAINDSMTKVLRSVNGVRHVQRYALKQGILKQTATF